MNTLNDKNDITGGTPVSKQQGHQVRFRSSDEALNRGFEWAKAMALSYVREGFPAGPCYEAALPNRSAFCMRDVSHQALGAHFLGLSAHNRNMMKLFAENISQSKDWCSFWEICYSGEPCPADYKSDSRFWYNLPANFDVLTTCGRLAEWTGDIGYLTDPAMARFHSLSMNEFVKRWDRDGDGIVDRVFEDNARGIASYDEEEFSGYVAASDTLALEAAAYFEAARMYRLLGKEKEASDAEREGTAVADIYRNEWWNDAEKHYENTLYKDKSKGGVFTCTKAGFPLRYNLITDPEKIKAQLDYLIKHTPERNIEEQTYVPEILWKYKRDDEAMKLWLHLTDENCARREYPEVSFAMAETLITGYLGISVSAENHAVDIRPAVPEGQWAEAEDIPLWNGFIGLRVDGGKSVTLENRSGHSLTLRCGTENVSVPDSQTAVCSL